MGREREREMGKLASWFLFSDRLQIGFLQFACVDFVYIAESGIQANLVKIFS